jgi:pSer/pThr/pTyr-binding forkhead associated (FHA) protein
MSHDNTVTDSAPPVSDGCDAPIEAVVEAVLEPTTSATLVVKRNGAETTEEFVVNSPCTIGRFDPSVGPIDIDLGSMPEGAYVSRKHAKITFEEGSWRITDLGSSNGTFVLGADFDRVDSAPINNATEIALGNARFVFYCTESGDDDTDTEPSADANPVEG